MVEHQYITDIPQECDFCKRKPIKLIMIRRYHLFRSKFMYQSFVCKEHIDRAIADSYVEDYKNTG